MDIVERLVFLPLVHSLPVGVADVTAEAATEIERLRADVETYVKAASELEQDASRYRWLMADHDDAATRAKCRELLGRMEVMSYAAASHAIDAAMKGFAGEAF